MKIHLVVIGLLLSSLIACSGSDSDAKNTPFDPETMSMEPKDCEASEFEGYTGEFETFSHGVSGTATIIDDCSIQISNFTYDGGGPAVYFYADSGEDFDYEGEDAFAIWDTISGITFDEDDFVIYLPEGKSVDDFNTLAVWCVDFNADFGHVEFLEP